MLLLRSLVFLAWMYGLMFLMGLVWLPSLILPRSVIRTGVRWYAGQIRWGLIAICGIRTEFRGLEHLPPGPIIYAAKHQCMWDVFVPFLILADPVITMKRELLWYPFLGWYAMKLRMIAIDHNCAYVTARSGTFL